VVFIQSPFKVPINTGHLVRNLAKLFIYWFSVLKYRKPPNISPPPPVFISLFSELMTLLHLHAIAVEMPANFIKYFLNNRLYLTNIKHFRC
jgi:hypothetical protein